MGRKLEIGDVFVVRHRSSPQDSLELLSIVPLYVPITDIIAADVSEMSESQQQQMTELVIEYNQYYLQHCSSAFDFETWAELSKQIVLPSLKYRTLKPTDITVV